MHVVRIMPPHRSGTLFTYRRAAFSQLTAHVQTLSRRLEAHRFDHFPRGRLEWHSATDQWRLYVDQKLLRGAFVTEVVFKWHSPKAQLVVRADPQYRSD